MTLFIGGSENGKDYQVPSETGYVYVSLEVHPSVGLPVAGRNEYYYRKVVESETVFCHESVGVNELTKLYREAKADEWRRALSGCLIYHHDSGDRELFRSGFEHGWKAAKRN